MFCIQVMTSQGLPARAQLRLRNPLWWVSQGLGNRWRSGSYKSWLSCRKPASPPKPPSKACAVGVYAGYWCFLITEGLEKYWMLEGWFNVRLLVPKRVWNWQLMVGLSEKERILTKAWNLVEQSTGRCQAQPSSSSNSGTGQGYRNHGESGS